MDLLEALIAGDEHHAAREWTDGYAHWAGPAAPAWARAHAASARALYHANVTRTEPEHTDELFSRATRLTVESRRPFDSARVWLRFGQWQRRSRRPGAATASLLTRALEIFDYLGAARWAGVARADLRAAGHPIGQGPADRSPPDGDGALTPQQWRIVPAPPHAG